MKVQNGCWINSEYTKHLSKILNKLIDMKCYFKIIIPAITNLSGILELELMVALYTKR